jgi:hypothetical protein
VIWLNPFPILARVWSGWHLKKFRSFLNSGSALKELIKAKDLGGEHKKASFIGVKTEPIPFLYNIY